MLTTTPITLTLTRLPKTLLLAAVVATALCNPLALNAADSSIATKITVPPQNIREAAGNAQKDRPCAKCAHQHERSDVARKNAKRDILAGASLMSLHQPARPRCNCACHL